MEVHNALRDRCLESGVAGKHHKGMDLFPGNKIQQSADGFHMAVVLVQRIRSLIAEVVDDLGPVL